MNHLEGLCLIGAVVVDLPKHGKANPIEKVGEGVVDGGQGGKVAVAPDAAEPEKVAEEVVISGGGDVVPGLGDLHEEVLEGVRGGMQGKVGHLLVQPAKIG